MIAPLSNASYALCVPITRKDLSMAGNSLAAGQPPFITQRVPDQVRASQLSWFFTDNFRDPGIWLS